MVTSDGLKPRAAPQSPCVPPTCGCPLLREHLRGPRCLSDRLLRGDEFTAANVADGSLCKALHSAESLLTGGRGVPRLPLAMALPRDR